MITSNSNAKIKHVINLLTNAKARRDERAFVVEGARIVREIPQDKIIECFISESVTDRSIIPNGIEAEVVSEAVFRKMADTKSPQGILCVVSSIKLEADDFLRKLEEGKNSVIKLLVLEGLQDPGNMGTIIRTAEGAGFSGIICDNKTVDIYNPKVTRSTMGSLFRVPVMYTDDILGVIDQLKSLGIKICAAHLKGEADYCDVEYGNKVAVLIGNEGNGLTDAISKKADLLVKIPMGGKLESLNAAVAAALMMYEIRKS